MVLKYKNKIYSSEDLPIFLFFKTIEHKRNFVNDLNNYDKPNTFVRFHSIDVAFAGNTVIKDRRSSLYFNLDSLEEKRSLQKHIHNTAEDSNAIISTPADIEPRVLEQWIEKNLVHLI